MAGEQHIPILATLQEIDPVASVEEVDPGAAHERVVPKTAVESVQTITADQTVVPAPSVDHVVTTEPKNGVGRWASLQSVVAVGSSIDPRTRSAMVRVRLDGAPTLVPGQILRLSIAATADRGSFNVPRAAVTELKGKTVVFVASRGGFDPVPVRVLARGAELTTVAGPLKAENHVAIVGVTELKAMGLQN